MSKYFHTSPLSFAEYDYKSFIWQYDRMIEFEKKKDNNPNMVDFTNPG